jgi:hypothetical protein
MREDAVVELLQKTSDNKKILNMLLEDNQIEKTEFGGHFYYLRKFRR